MSRSRKIAGNILITLTAVFTLYLSVIMVHRISTVVLKGTYTKIFIYELAACLIFLLFSLDVRFDLFSKMKNRAAKAAGIVLRILIAAAVAFILFIAGRICVGSFIDTSAPADKVIVLGLALQNGKPTDDLISRLDTAQDYLNANPGAVLILTGGNPDESGRTEAAIMRDILNERGVAADRMILEDQAETTKENFRNTLSMADPDEAVVLISSNYHMDRASRTASDAGFGNVLRLPAPSSPLYYGANVMWEVILEINEMTLRQD